MKGKIKIMEIKLLSSEMVYTPSIIGLVMELAGQGKMKVADKILESYNLTKTVRLGVLHGIIPWRVEGETVILTIQ